MPQCRGFGDGGVALRRRLIRKAEAEKGYA